MNMGRELDIIRETEPKQEMNKQMKKKTFSKAQ